MKRHYTTFKRILITFISLLFICIDFSGCNIVPQTFEDIERTFEKDYSLLKEVVDYMEALSEEHELHGIFLRREDNFVMSVNHGNIYGEDMEIRDEEIKKTLKTLFRRGYMSVDFDKENSEKKTTIHFERWRKAFEYEYRSGFAYAPENVGELNIQYIISQKELSTPDWYYFEEDYNEWRRRKYPY